MSSRTMGNKLAAYAKLVRLHKPIGIFLLLWPTLWAITIASAGQPDAWILTVFILGVILTRSAGCAINDYADKNFDGHVARTKSRPLVTGEISPTEAKAIFVALNLSAFVLVLTLNTETILASFVAVMLMATYPFMKRFTHLPQLVLGAAFGFAVPMAFLAVTKTLPPIAWGLYAITLIWTLMYDTQYAMADRADDAKIGVKSSALLFGAWDNHWLLLMQALVLIGFVGVGLSIEAGMGFYLSLAIASALFLYQQWLTFERVPARCFQAFLNNHWVGCVVYLGLVWHYNLAGIST